MKRLNDLDYLKLKFKSLFLKGEAKQTNKEMYQGLRQQRKLYKKLERIMKEEGYAKA